ncbi:MAG: hypothetical protein J6D54_03145 [Olsenella sp.]|nr:hypothetical protein [Olsenella sp.]
MRKLREKAAITTFMATGAIVLAVTAAPALANEGGCDMHRLYNPYTGEHFYTASQDERDTLASIGWSYEGIGWVAPTEGSDVYRLYNRFAGDHHYTTSPEERDALVAVGWSYEGVGWKSGGDVALWRQYNPYARAGAHNYTTSREENDNLCSIGWQAEGVGWYGVGAGKEASLSKYSYQAYRMETQDAWTGFPIPIYIKTDNPDPDSLFVKDTSLDDVGGSVIAFDDVHYLTEGFHGNNDAVDGGCLLSLNIRKPGVKTITICERSDAFPKGIPVVTFDLNVLDTSVEQNKWIDEVIESQTNPSMDSFEKMEAICSYLTSKAGFRYNAVREEDGHHKNLCLLRDMCKPYWITKRWDSFVSPAVLKRIAERVGGFDEVHNCYGDAAYGTADWYAYHFTIWCRKGDKTERYWVCPDASSGVVDDIDYIDFNDPSDVFPL